MKTLSEFKNKLQVGVKLQATHHLTFAGRDEITGEVLYKDQDLGIREVTIKQSNSFALKTKRSTGEVVDSWCSYPKLSEVDFLNDGIIIHEINRGGKRVPVLTYKFIES